MKNLSFLPFLKFHSKVSLALLLICSTVGTLHAQEPQWYLGADRVDFRGGGAIPTLYSISGGNALGNAPNEAYNISNGDTLFHVVDGVITIAGVPYDVGGGTYPKPNGNSYAESYQTAIIQVPGECNFWYVIGIKMIPSGGIDNFYLRYLTVSTAGKSLTAIGGIKTATQILRKAVQVVLIGYLNQATNMV